MVINLVDKEFKSNGEKTLSGKGLNWSWLGLNDDFLKKDAAIFKKISAGIKDSTMSVDGLVLAMKKLSPEGLKTAQAINKTSADVNKLAPAFDAAATSLSTMTLKTKAAELGMKALKVASNMAAGFIAGLVLDAVLNLVNAQKEARDSAVEAGAALQENTGSIKSYSDKITELTTKLNGSNLSEQEAYETRSQLITIQDELYSKYGKEANGLDLVNGELSKQLGLLNEINKTKANKFLNENKAAIDDASTEMEKKQSYLLFPELSTDLINTDEIQSIIKDLDLTLAEYGGNNGKFGLTINVDAKQAQETINDFGDRLRKLYDSNFIDEKTYQVGTDFVEDALKQNNKILDKYQKNYDNGVQATIQVNEKYQNIQSATLEARNAYNEAIAKSDEDAIRVALEQMASVKNDFQNSNIENSGVNLYFNKFFDEFEQQSSKHQFKIDLSINKDNLQSDIDKALLGLKGLDDNEILSLGNTQGTQEQENAYDILCAIAERYKINIQDIIDLLVEQGRVQGNLANNSPPPLTFDLTNISDNLKTFNDSIAIIYSNMDLLDKAADEFNITGGIASDTFKSLADNNLLQYLQFTSDGLNILTTDLLNNEQATKRKAQADLASALYSDLANIATRNLSDAEYLAEQASINAGNAAETAGAQYAKSATGILTAAEATNLYNKVSGIAGFDFKSQAQQVALVVAKYNSATSAIEKMRSSTESASNSFNRMGSSAKKASETIKKSVQDAQSSIKSLLSTVMSMLKQEYADSKKALQERLKSIKELEDAAKKANQTELDGIKQKIDAQLDLLKAEKERHDYLRGLQDKTKDVSNIKSELEKLKFDDSAEAIKKKLELQEQLTDKVTDLEDYQYDNSIKLQENALNEEKERIEEIYKAKLEAIESEYKIKTDSLEKQIQNIEDYVSIEGNIRTEAMALIEGKSSELYQKLLDWNKQYGTGIDEDIKQQWLNCYSAMDTYNQGQYNVLATLELLAQKMAEISKSASSMAGSIGTEIGKATDALKDLNDEYFKHKYDGRLKEDTYDYLDKGKYPAAYGKNPTSLPKNKDYTKFKIPKLHSGGFVDTANISDNLRKLFEFSNNESVYKLQKGELVLTNYQQENIAKSLGTSQTRDMSKLQLTAANDTPNIIMGDIIIQGNADNNTVRELKKFQDDIINSMFEKINKHR